MSVAGKDSAAASAAAKREKARAHAAERGEGAASTLTGVRLIAGRELAAYFDSMIAYVVSIAFVVLASYLFMNEFFLVGRVEMTGFFEWMPILLPFFLPAVTMRLWAEERKTRTVELLLTLPIRPIQAVVGKYLAALALFLITLAGTLPIVIMLAALGDPDGGRIFASYLGVALLGSFFLSLGAFLSALTRDQIVAFVFATFWCVVFVFSGQDRVVTILDGRFPDVLLGTRLRDYVSVMPHVEAFGAGVIQLSSVLYFVGLTVVFLWVTALVLERNRG